MHPPTDPALSPASSREDSETRRHHPCSPSSLQAKAASPCYVGRSGTNEAAERGTLQHAAAESEEDHEDLSDEEAEAVARCLECVSELKADLTGAGLEWAELKEQFLAIDGEKVVDPRDGSGWEGTTGGYADTCVVWPAYSEHTGERIPDTYDGAIFDWKYGRYKVPDSVDNLQGKAYYLGLSHRLKKAGETLRNCTVAFLSPHRETDPEPATFTPGDFERIRLEVARVVGRWFFRQARISLLSPDRWQDADEAAVAKIFTPTDSTCIWCANLGWCPAVRNVAVSVGNKYRPLEVPNDPHGFSETRPEGRAAMLKLGDLLVAWKAEVRARFTQHAVEDPRIVPSGYLLISTNPRRVVDPVGLRAFLVEQFGEEVVAAHEELPLTPFEKLITADAPRGEKKAALEFFQNQLAESGLVEPSTRPVVSLRMQ